MSLVFGNSKIPKTSRQFYRTFSIRSEIPTEYDDFEDEEYVQMSSEFLNHLLPQNGHRVLILQPSRNHRVLHLKSGSEDQSLFEARALVSTLKSWQLVDEDYVNVRNLNSTTFFSSGTYETLTESFRNRTDISAVFVNLNVLSALQVMTLERDWHKIIYDRYMMVLQIFKLHAKSSESKLQVQLAELPYFRSRLYGYHLKSHSDVVLRQMDKSLSNSGLPTSSIEDKYAILKTREHKIKSKLKELECKRAINRQSRKHTNLPIISVLGYTNAGKTSLIKHLTRDEKIEPRNCFFATLDVTYHDFFMKLNESNYGMKTILIDTIGFMSDIPTTLISAFRTTLKETVETDLLIHVVDVSSEYWKMQLDFTLETLKSFNLPEKLMKSIVTVGTKIDCISREDLEIIMEMIPNFIPISNKTGENINSLHRRISTVLQQNIEFIVKRLKVNQGSEIYQWINSNAVIQHVDVSQVDGKILLEVLFLPKMWAKFQCKFHQK